MSTLQEIITCPLCRKTATEVPQQCNLCHNSFQQELAKMPSVVDLTCKTLQRQTENSITETKPLRTELFRFPIVSFLYERILPPLWAVGLRNSGGIDAELRLCTEFFGQSPGIVADVSCGTGIMARRLAKWGKCEQILALDYSETMLSELQQQMQLEGISPSEIIIIRADVEALPLAPNSIDAIYAGAAIHCWDDPTEGIRNIYQALRPGGKLLATTFLKPYPSIVFQFFSPEELRHIVSTAGFHSDSIQVQASGFYGIIKCIK
ncbi:class I SAM-dependent methyltransferase [Scytonema sp. NUACC26]|uniref:class I SAM-dependent methyltransferase n=1 Tax=Scytonema sp. NUACC26 TaxID=3140176 RepID=UPI0034DC7D9C